MLHFVDTNVAGGLGGIISDTWDAGRDLWGRVFGGSGGAPPGVNTRPWTSPPIASPWARPLSTPMGLGRWNGVLTVRGGNKLPMRGGPVNGTLTRGTSTASYNHLGLQTRRVDLTGRADNGVPTPHVHEYSWKLNNGQWTYTKLKVRALK